MLMRHARVPTVTTDVEGHLLAVNRAACDLLGSSQERLMRREWRDLVHHDDVASDRANTSLLRGGRHDHFSLPIRLLLPDGGVLHTQVTTVLVDPSGDSPRLVRQFADIPRPRSAHSASDTDRELRLAQIRYRAVVETLAEGVVIRSGGRVVDANAAAKRILGLSLEGMDRGPSSRRESHARAIRPDGSEFPSSQHPSEVARRTGRLVRDVVMGVERAGGQVVWLLVNAQPIPDPDGKPSDTVVTSFTDITALKQAESQLMHQAMHDPLTGLPNRSLLLEHVSAALRRHDRTGESLALLFVDLDGFKAVNDEAGHQVGDEILGLVAHRLVNSLRSSDIAGRIGGDEFLIICEGTRDETLEMLAERILERLAEPLQLGSASYRVGASIGITVATPGTSPDELVRLADSAMYQAKRAGGNGHVTLLPT